MRLFSTLFTVAILGIGFWLFWQINPSFREVVQSYVENGEFLTLEARYSAEQIMQQHSSELLPDDQYSYQEPNLKFYPYLLMEVKYTQANGRTREGVILWSMVDGEMVIDTDTWEKTHGFEDTINAGANRMDFLIINTLARYRGTLPASRLQKELNLDQKQMEQALESARKKYLVILKGNEIALHFQSPNFNVLPQTRINQWLVTKPYNHAQRVGKRYNQSQIERNAKAAFGHDFTVRNSKVVFLPIYNIEVLNPDGSILTSYWNALNGQRVDTKYLSLSP
ncbi:MAG: hypothetical protein K940chlam7_00249 [Chlamydiae bacterium]|nr:hypothetical protein [Chlamydiota bacterium]